MRVTGIIYTLRFPLTLWSESRRTRGSMISGLITFHDFLRKSKERSVTRLSFSRRFSVKIVTYKLKTNSQVSLDKPLNRYRRKRVVAVSTHQGCLWYTSTFTDVLCLSDFIIDRPVNIFFKRLTYPTRDFWLSWWRRLKLAYWRKVFEFKKKKTLNQRNTLFSYGHGDRISL